MESSSHHWTQSHRSASRNRLRAGEVDIIVAKHRNGPTRDVTVSFQVNNSRFVAMTH